MCERERERERVCVGEGVCGCLCKRVSGWVSVCSCVLARGIGSSEAHDVVLVFFCDRCVNRDWELVNTYETRIECPE